MSEEFTQPEQKQEEVVVGSAETEVQSETVETLPSATALFTEGIKFAMSRLDIIGIVFVTTLGMSIISVLLEYTTSTGLNILMIIASIIAMIVGVINGAVLIYVFANSSQNPSYVDGVRWLGKKFLPYIWIGLCVGLLKMGGFALLFVPGIILSVYAVFSLMVFATEDTRGFATIMRSRQLVYGRFWKTVGTFSLLSASILLIILAIGGLVMLAGDAALSFVSSEELVPMLVMTFLITAIQVAGTALGTGLVAHVYHTYVQATPLQEVDAKIRKKYIVITWIGVIIIPVFIALGVIGSVYGASQEIQETSYQQNVADVLFA